MNFNIKLTFWLSFTLLFCLGFRSIPQFDGWDIDKSSATNSKIFIKYSNGTRTVKNNLSSDDVLAGGGTLTVDQMMTSIFDDFNGIAASYLTLVNSGDADFGARGNDRTIDFLDSGASGVVGGEASLNMDGNLAVGCTIKGTDKLFSSAVDFIRTMTHEIGHCIGLLHPQETVNSIMSYFSDYKDVRLMIDDKMGIVFLYPVDESAAKETSTFGLSCARKGE